MDKQLQLLTIKETVERSKAEGMPLTEYTLRRLLKTGKIKHRQIGGKYLIYWPNVVKYLTCEDEDDMEPEPQLPPGYGTIRRIDARRRA